MNCHFAFFDSRNECGRVMQTGDIDVMASPFLLVQLLDEAVDFSIFGRYLCNANTSEASSSPCILQEMRSTYISCDVPA